MHVLRECRAQLPRRNASYAGRENITFVRPLTILLNLDIFSAEVFVIQCAKSESPVSLCLYVIRGQN